MKKTIFFLISVIFLSSCSMQKKINEMNSKIDNLQSDIDSIDKKIADEMNNQTSLFYETVGKVLPVVIPENENEKMKALQDSIQKLKSETNQEHLDAASNLYFDFLKSTAPWIQEKLSDEILNAKYDLDFYSIVNEYKVNSDSENILKELEDFIVRNGDYENIRFVIDFYNDILEKQKIQYESAVSALKEKLEKLANNRNASLSEIQSAILEAEPYSESQDIANLLLSVNEMSEESEMRQKLEEEVNLLKKNIAFEKDENLEIASHTLYSEELAGILYRTKLLKRIATDNLETQCGETATLLNNFEENIKRKQERKYADQISETLSGFLTTIRSLPFDERFNAISATLYEQIARISLDVREFKYENQLPIFDLIESCNKAIDQRRIEFEKTLKEQDERDIKTYNSNSLSLIQDMKRRHESIGTFDSGKSETRISLLLELEKIQTSYLFLPINSVYQEVYQGIYEKLNQDEKFNFATRALSVRKRGLNENF